MASAQAAMLPAERSAIRSTAYQLPLTFEVNQGQTDGQVKFLARGQGYTIFLTPTEAVFALPRPDVRKPARTVMRMQLVGSASAPRMQGVDELPGRVHYFRGDDSARWRTNVRTYKRVKYTAVYPGVDLIYYGQPQQLEYDFIVAPGADPSRIKLAFTGVDDTTVDAKGDLVLKTAGEPLRFQRPMIYQMKGGRRHTVEGSYVLTRPHEIGFQVGAYDRKRPLIIDPVLTYSTYLGGSGIDEGNGIAVDATGAAYVSGTTGSPDFPTVDAPQPAPNPGPFEDTYIAKLTPDGTALVYATYLGGSDHDVVADIAIDSTGAAYVSGPTYSSDFPTVRALQATSAGDSDAFVAKLSADGSQLVYSTYLGGRGAENVSSIALDSTGSAYIGGTTESPDFPAVNPVLPACGGAIQNAFVAKLTPDGTALVYSTYLGGTGIDGVGDIAVDSLGAVYAIGSTTSDDFPLANPVSARGGDWDAFVTKLAPGGTRLIYSTYLGGSGFEEGFGIAADGSGAAYVTGNTGSEDFPTINALQPVNVGNLDAFVVKLAPEGGAAMYATFLGGSGWDRGYRIGVDITGAAYVTGFTESRDFPTMNPLQPALSGPRDAFVSKLSPNGADLDYSTYLGGSADDGISIVSRPSLSVIPSSMAIVVDLTGAAYVTGQTRSTDFPTVNPLQPAFAGGDGDAFIVKISGDDDVEHFNDLDGAFVLANGEVRRSEHEGIYTEDRHYITTTRSDYISSDWTYEVTVRSPSDGPPDILYIGIGSASPDPTYFNEAANSLMFRIHQGWIDGRVDVGAHPTGPSFTYLAEAVGALPADSGREFTEFTAHIAKVGNTIEFSICRLPSDAEPCEPEIFHKILDVSAAAPFLSSGDTYLFFGNGSGSYAFTKATISPGPANDSVSGSEGNGDSGGGSIDALLALLLAHFAFVQARRRRIRPDRRPTYS